MPRVFPSTYHECLANIPRPLHDREARNGLFRRRETSNDARFVDELRVPAVHALHLDGDLFTRGAVIAQKDLPKGAAANTPSYHVLAAWPCTTMRRKQFSVACVSGAGL